MRIYYGPSHALHNINFHEIASSGNRVACGQTDRQADRYDGAFVVFCKSANSPENECFTVRTLTNKQTNKKKKHDACLWYVTLQLCWAVI